MKQNDEHLHVRRLLLAVDHLPCSINPLNVLLHVLTTALWNNILVFTTKSTPLTVDPQSSDVARLLLERDPIRAEPNSPYYKW